MKNNKGFTLIELLAIVIILAIIMIIAAPSITGEIKRSEKYNENILNQKIENAAHIYAAKYYANKIVKKENFDFSLKTLVDEGLVSFKNNICKYQLLDKKSIYFKDGTFNYTEIGSNNCYVCENGCEKK